MSHLERKGFPIDDGFVGFVNGRKMKFETEGAYNEHMDNLEKEGEVVKKSRDVNNTCRRCIYIDECHNWDYYVLLKTCPLTKE